MRMWQEWQAAARLLWRAGPRHTVALAVTVVCGALTGPLIVVATGRLVGVLPGAVEAGAGSAEARRALVALTAFGALTLVRSGLRALESGLAAVLRLRAASVVMDRAITAGTGPDGIGHLEDPGYADTLRLATDQGTRPDQLASLLPEIVRPRLEGIGLLVLLAPLAWWAPLLMALTAVLTYRSYLRLSRQVHGSMESASAVIRRAGYLRSLAVDPEPAKEIRLFGLGDWLAERMTAVWQSGMARVWATRGTAARRAYGAVGFVVLAEGVVLGYAAFAAARGGLGLTQLVISAQAALALPALGWVGDDDLMVRDALLGLRSLAALAHHCAHLPLALRIAAARLAARPRWPVRELADRLADPERRLAELSFADLDMYAALEAGHRELLAHGPTGRAAALALHLLASGQGELTVTGAAAATGGESSATEAILEQLVDVQFLESPAPGRYRFHPLTRLFALRSATETGGASRFGTGEG